MIPNVVRVQQAVYSALGVWPQVGVLDEDGYYAQRGEPPMVGVFTTQGSTLESARMVAEALDVLGFQRWGHGGGPSMLVDGFEGGQHGAVWVWGKLPPELHLSA
jgi:hypothetical protein